MWPFSSREPELKHEHEYVAPVVTEMYDNDGFKLVPGLFGGYVREVDLKPVPEYRPPIWGE